MSYAIIGDVHSQGHLLAKALAHCKTNGLTPILLGDLFDSRCDIDETLYTRNLVMMAQREQGAIVLNSNHQERLVDAIDGSLPYGDYCAETFRSLDHFSNSNIDLSELRNWLMAMPDGFVFFDKDGLEHCCAHAYFPVQLRKPPEQKAYKVWATSVPMKEKMVWGPMKRNGRRYHWWKHVSDSQSFVRVAGHYHKVLTNDRAIVLDANSGFEDGAVPLYEVDNKNLVYFSESSVTIEQDNLEVA